MFEAGFSNPQTFTSVQMITKRPLKRFQGKNRNGGTMYGSGREDVLNVWVHTSLLSYSLQNCKSVISEQLCLYLPSCSYPNSVIASFSQFKYIGLSVNDQLNEKYLGLTYLRSEILKVLTGTDRLQNNATNHRVPGPFSLGCQLWEEFWLGWGKCLYLPHHWRVLLSYDKYNSIFQFSFLLFLLPDCS